MTGVNLLPWREERRRERDRQQMTTAVLIWILCVTAMFGAWSYLGLVKENQQKRNDYLVSEIAALNEKIDEIGQLRTQRDNLVARMEVIQNLQSERTQVVHMLDDIVRRLPEGVYFDSVEKQDHVIKLKGAAQSNATVSNLMDRLDSSDWFSHPDLDAINVTPSEGVRLSEFNLTVSQERGRTE